MRCDPELTESRANALPRNTALTLSYTGQVPVALPGSITGTVYEFSPAQPNVPVDPRDARFFLASPSFRLAK
jgi:hypothetical protein